MLLVFCFSLYMIFKVKTTDKEYDLSPLCLACDIFCGVFFFFPPAKARVATFERLATGGKGGWLNVTRPLTVDDMHGRLVLLDFWTYGCINCMQIVPDLEYIEKEFGDRVLVISVHSAKFKAEQGNERILAAAKRFGLNHPVINDSDFAIWKSFKVRAWPTLVLLDATGEEISRYTGEGHRDDLVKDIKETLANMPTSAFPPPTAEKENKAWDVVSDESESLLYFPARLAVSEDGKLFVSDSGHNRILGLDDDGTVSVIIGSGEEGFSDGSFETATFNHPRGMTFLNGVLYVADTNNHALRRVDFKERTVTTVAGTGERGFIPRAKNRPARTVAIASPWDLEPLGDGETLAVAMAGTHQLWVFDTEKNTLSVLAGTSGENIDDGKSSKAKLAQPSALSFSGGTLFFADAESSALRKLENGKVSTLIGTGLFDFGLKDGKYPEAMMQHPQGLWADKDRVLITDTYNNAIRIYNRKSGELSTMSLTGEPLNEPGDILVHGNKAWIADTNSHAIRTLDLDSGSTSIFPLLLDQADE